MGEAGRHGPNEPRVARANEARDSTHQGASMLMSFAHGVGGASLRLIIGAHQHLGDETHQDAEHADQ